MNRAVTCDMLMEEAKSENIEAYEIVAISTLIDRIEMTAVPFNNQSHKLYG